jgi:glutamate--cysteine ligase
LARDQSDGTPLHSRHDLVAWFAEGEKPAAEHRLGTEHEKIPFRLADRSPVNYEGPFGIRDLLDELAQRTGWAPIIEDDHPIGLYDPRGGGAISLEPGGQFELSGAPLATLHDTAAELDRHLADVKAISEALGIGFLSVAMSPLWTRAQTPAMPKKRYRIMTAYMPKVGKLGLDMMYRTSTVQVNLDFASEADMVRKLRVSLALQPVATALFANSPFTDGKPNGHQSYRSAIWLDTDRDRTGMLPFAFEPGMGYERYVDYALDVPMYFVKRGDTYHDVSGGSFRQLMVGRLPQLPGVTATIADWANHISTIFPEVRVKRYLEMRGADAGPRDMLLGLPAFWVGLLYDPAALDAAEALTRPWSSAERQTLRNEVPILGLRASIGGRPLLDVARDAVAIASSGLARRACRSGDGLDESVYLGKVAEIAASGVSEAERLLQCYRTNWAGDIGRVFAECRY